MADELRWRRAVGRQARPWVVGEVERGREKSELGRRCSQLVSREETSGGCGELPAARGAVEAEVELVSSRLAGERWRRRAR